MKLKFLFCLSLISFANQLFSQNYQPIIQNNASFFNNSNQIRAIQIDSIKTINNLQINHLNKVWNQENECIKPSGKSWLGEFFVKKGDTYLFFNNNNDTIVINPNFKINNTWIFYKYASGKYINAKIIKKELREVLTLVDTVETISLQVMNSDNTVYNSNINAVTFEISKNYGFVKTIDLLDFPQNYNTNTLIGLTNPNIGKTYITEKEINNFDIGDEFHYDIAQSNPPYGTGKFTNKIKKLIDKKIVANTDSLIYTFQVISKNHIIDWSTNIKSDFISVDTVVEKYLFNYKPQFLPLQPITHNEFEYRSYDLYKFYNNSRILFTPNYNLHLLSENCWHKLIFFGVSSVGGTYMEGCGLFSIDNDEGISQSHEKLVYYKKGNETWGTPYLITSINENIDYTSQIFPNPISDDEILTINSIEDYFEIQIFDLLGNELLSLDIINSKTNKFNLNHLKSGIYILKLKTHNNTIRNYKLQKK